MSERAPGRGSVVRVLVAEDMRILRETLVAHLFGWGLRGYWAKAGQVTPEEG